MKYLFALLMVLSLVSCREEEAAWDNLSNAEREALRQRATSKCLADELADIKDIISRSTNLTEDYERRDTWEITNTKNDVSVSVNKIHVWKTTATDVYFLYRQSDSSGDFSKFIKVNIARNKEHFEDLRRKKCAVSETDSAQFTSATLSSSVMTGSVKYARVPVDNSTYSVLTTTHTYSSEFPAIFGLLSKSRVKKTYNKEDDVLKDTETYKWAIKRVSDIANNDLEQDYTHPTFTNPRFCVATFTPAVVGPPAEVAKYPLPTVEASLNCQSSTTASAPDADGDGVSDFAAAELVL